MTRLRNHNRTLAVVLLLVAAVVWFLTFEATARAGVSPGTDPSTPTTEEPTTTTTEAVTTTTAARTTTTSSVPRSTTSSVPRSTSSESTTSLVTTTTVEAAPEIVTDDTLPPRSSASDEGGLSTDTKLALVVGSLVAVALALGLLTFFYWRHTRPQQYMTALDALADVEQKVPRNADDVPTAEHAVLPTAAAGGVGATGAAVGATTAVRILEPDATEPGTTTSGEGKDAEPDHVSTREPRASVLDEPTTITTVEDLRADGASDGNAPG